MKELRRYVLTLCTAVCVALTVVAQGSVEIKDARFEPDSVLLGDHFELVMDIVSRGDVALALPEIGADFAEGNIELLQDLGLDTLSVGDDGYQLRKRWRMTSFEPAVYSIDSLGLLWTDGTTIDTLFAPHALTLEVALMPVDTAQKTIYDIKQPLTIPVTVAEVMEVAGYSFAALAVVVALVALIVYLVRKSCKEELASRKKEPAHVVAIRALVVLSTQKLWQNGKVKEYWSRLTEIFRTYLVGRYGVGALEMTTEEIVEAMGELELTERQSSELKSLLMESDLVKFAKHTPTAESNEAAYYTIYYFVEESKEVAEEVVAPEAQEPESVTINQTEEEPKDE